MLQAAACVIGEVNLFRSAIKQKYRAALSPMLGLGVGGGGGANNIKHNRPFTRLLFLSARVLI